MRVGAKRRKNTADIGALQGIGNLHAKKAETDIP